MGQLSPSHCQQPHKAVWLSRPIPKQMSNKFLIVGDNPDSSWTATVREALAPLGESETFTASEAESPMASLDYQMIIIDAGAVEEVTSLIQQMRQQSSSVLIIVATAAPTWQTAKEVFMTGANDYIRKSLDPSSLRTTLKDILYRSR